MPLNPITYPTLSHPKMQKKTYILPQKWAIHEPYLLSSVLYCLNGVIDTRVPPDYPGDVEKYCFTDISGPWGEGFPPWSRRNQCYIMGLLCGYVLHITKGRKINIPPVVNLMLWQFFLCLFFALMYGPYNTELETGIDTTLQRSILYLFFCCIKLSRFWYSCSNMMWGLCLFWLVFACCRGYGGNILQKRSSNDISPAK